MKMVILHLTFTQKILHHKQHATINYLRIDMDQDRFRSKNGQENTMIKTRIPKNGESEMTKSSSGRPTCILVKLCICSMKQ